MSFSGNLWIGPDNMENLRPDVLGRIVAATSLTVVHRSSAPYLHDVLCLCRACVVLPEHEHRIRILRKFLLQGQRGTLGIGQRRSRSRGIDTDSNDFILACTSFEHAIKHLSQHLDIVQRVLTER